MKKHDQKEKTKSQNALFTENPKKIYRIISNNTIEVTKMPDKNQLDEYWRSLYGDSAEHNRTVEWINETRNEMSEVPEMQEIQITEEIIKNKLSRAPNFKSPGPDKIQN